MNEWIKIATFCKQAQFSQFLSFRISLEIKSCVVDVKQSVTHQHTLFDNELRLIPSNGIFENTQTQLFSHFAYDIIFEDCNAREILMWQASVIQRVYSKACGLHKLYNITRNMQQQQNWMRKVEMFSQLKRFSAIFFEIVRTQLISFKGSI